MTKRMKNESCNDGFVVAAFLMEKRGADVGFRIAGRWRASEWPTGLMWEISSSAAFESGLSGVSGMIGDVGKVAGIKVMKPASLYRNLHHYYLSFGVKI